MAEFTDELRHVFDVHRLIFRIGELASMTGVSPRQLRYWEKKGFIKSREREGEQARVYSFGTFVKVSMIKYFLDSGYTLAAAVQKAAARNSRAKVLHRFISTGLQGFAEVDGQLAINLGPFDDQQTLMAILPDDGAVTYRLLPNQEAQRLTRED
ncbi:MerR family transcriptional regulator [Levilactobacillus zymae]|uniref:MerR family transcriptional regulator n=1 Tax=Levilactobacillus zymae TaxID=267363 RepID=UPI0028B53FA8|nr:MerR family transcriptional regulator [Levilactobacillus zymae]MDT6981174.1 MerR family transcriptional regulator [Levilactobacillus zymae]